MDIFLQIVLDQVRVEAGEKQKKTTTIFHVLLNGYVELSVPGNSMDGNYFRFTVNRINVEKFSFEEETSGWEAICMFNILFAEVKGRSPFCSSIYLSPVFSNFLV